MQAHLSVAQLQAAELQRIPFHLLLPLPPWARRRPIQAAEGPAFGRRACPHRHRQAKLDWILSLAPPLPLSPGQPASALEGDGMPSASLPLIINK